MYGVNVKATYHSSTLLTLKLGSNHFVMLKMEGDKK